MKTHSTVEEYIANYDVSEIIPDLKEYALEEDNELDWNEEDFDRSKDMIEGRLKALIARNLWDFSAYYQVFNPYWGTYNKALELLQQGDYEEFNLAQNRF